MSSSPAAAAVHRFYSTDVAACPYLEGREERRLVAVVEPGEAGERLDLLTEAGFRRSQNFLYKPACPACSACVPVRIAARSFEPSRNLRRVLRRNEDLAAAERPARATLEQFDLFRRYLLSRHADGGMTRMGWEAYRDMVEVSPSSTRMVEFRDAGGRLVGASLTDHVRSGLSGVYKFFDPEDERRSLGTFIILWHALRARELGLPYVYLGYWIAECRKMTYKARFAPLERLDGAFWAADVADATPDAGRDEG
jgi:arginyl-tRNA--protein-N-Asp/Glu arginylyltransferase